MCISLVAHIPYQLIFGSIENIVKGNSKLDNAQAGAKMPGVYRDHIDNEIPYFPAQLWQLLHRHLPKVRRRIYRT